MKILNLCPHDIILGDEESDVLVTVKESGCVARVKIVREVVGHVFNTPIFERKNKGVMFEGNTRYELGDYDVIITSKMVVEYSRGTEWDGMFVYPDGLTAVRDENGNVLYATQLNA